MLKVIVHKKLNNRNIFSLSDITVHQVIFAVMAAQEFVFCFQWQSKLVTNMYKEDYLDFRIIGGFQINQINEVRCHEYSIYKTV